VPPGTVATVKGPVNVIDPLLNVQVGRGLLKSPDGTVSSKQLVSVEVKPLPVIVTAVLGGPVLGASVTVTAWTVEGIDEM